MLSWPLTVLAITPSRLTPLQAIPPWHPDAAQSDALVADVPVTDAALSDAESVSDAGSAPDIVTAMSSVQRIADPQVPAADITTLASDNAAFAFAAYQQLITTNTNLVFSPASISIALAMTYAGAATTTATEMAQRTSLHPATRAVAPGVQCSGPDSGLTWSGLPGR